MNLELDRVHEAHEYRAARAHDQLGAARLEAADARAVYLSELARARRRRFFDVRYRKALRYYGTALTALDRAEAAAAAADGLLTQPTLDLEMD